ncbi:keratin, type I cytoskeletal 9-like [Neltuma alba]|uniref:keratin, type I cytoskeletal 9-like n=1 Tax=Neltuma alba TaxID=207710 RepID=UPI0010A37B86|nr:keratin, type I cytoskeletal 9-like [Prosopis alba]
MIHLKVLKGLEMESGFLTLIYSPPKEQDRRNWWGKLKNLNSGNVVPWLCCGDFNDLLLDFEKEWRNTRDLSSLAEFQNFMTLCDMEDLGAKGLAFTWSNMRLNEANVKERLDCAVCNIFWREKHQNAQGLIESNWNRDKQVTIGMVHAFNSNLNRIRKILTKWSKIEFPNNQKLLVTLMEDFKNCYEGVWNENSASKASEFFVRDSSRSSGGRGSGSSGGGGGGSSGGGSNGGSSGSGRSNGSCRSSGSGGCSSSSGGGGGSSHSSGSNRSGGNSHSSGSSSGGGGCSRSSSGGGGCSSSSSGGGDNGGGSSGSSGSGSGSGGSSGSSHGSSSHSSSGSGSSSHSGGGGSSGNGSGSGSHSSSGSGSSSHSGGGGSSGNGSGSGHSGGGGGGSGCGGDSSSGSGRSSSSCSSSSSSSKIMNKKRLLRVVRYLHVYVIVVRADDVIVVVGVQ